MSRVCVSAKVTRCADSTILVVSGSQSLGEYEQKPYTPPFERMPYEQKPYTPAYEEVPYEQNPYTPVPAAAPQAEPPVSANGNANGASVPSKTATMAPVSRPAGGSDVASGPHSVDREFVTGAPSLGGAAKAASPATKTHTASLTRAAQRPAAPAGKAREIGKVTASTGSTSKSHANPISASDPAHTHVKSGVCKEASPVSAVGNRDMLSIKAAGSENTHDKKSAGGGSQASVRGLCERPAKTSAKISLPSPSGEDEVGKEQLSLSVGFGVWAGRG
jgi:hypothetical protein